MKNVVIKSFPWSPGIPWKVSRGMYVKPELPITLLDNVLKDKTPVVCCFGGLLEAFYSLTILEALNKTFSINKFLWSGNTENKLVYDANGLASHFDEIIPSDLIRFPTPIFFDKNDRVYFNALYNYLNYCPYYSVKGCPNFNPAIKKIVCNSTIPWKDNFIPEFRRPEEFGDISSLLKSRSINLNKPTIVILPDKTGVSLHRHNFLRWNEHEVKNFSVLASKKGYQVLILTNNPNSYWGINAKVIGFSIGLFFNLLPHTKFLLSNDADFLLIALSYPSVKLIFKRLDGPLNLYKNNRFLAKGSDMFYRRYLTTEEVLEVI